MEAQRKILVIDDAALFRDLVSFALARSGQVITATTGAEGLAAARREKPEVVVVDQDLPELSGDAVCKEIKTDAALPDTAVILVTSGASADDHERAVRAGADDILSKPINQRSLVLAVNRFLRVPVVRSLPRAPLAATVEIRCGNETLRGVGRDISRAGIFVEIDHPIPDGTEVRLEFRLPEMSAALCPTAEAIGSRGGTGAGRHGVAFRFLGLDRAGVELVEQYVHEWAVAPEPGQIPTG
ncbi:MAG: response regulator transcription factor [Myxococcales bacterium]|nr:response regulator transcription factor [Myxococcales bacterium]